MIDQLKRKLEDYQNLGREIELLCRDFCVDETKSVAERWEVFKLAPNKEFDSCYNLPPNDLLGFEISAYDDLGLDRCAVFDVVKRISWFEDGLTETYKSDFAKQLDQNKIDLLKNFYMVQYLGSWENDW